jgi:hypothetical protein
MDKKKNTSAGGKSPAVKPKNLPQAIIQVMTEVKGVEKSLNVGQGKFSYKGVSDQDVKKIVGEAMSRAGLCILPIDIDPNMKIERWEESTNYGPKSKQQIFVEVKTKYLLMHESGESMEICGYGHGVDSQDKSAGKATTYALKYALLYTFLVPTGQIDDADKNHSNETPVPAQKINARSLTADQFSRAMIAINNGDYEIESLEKDYQLTAEQIKEVESLKNK